ncbi:MAG: NUDIX domain-containing protein [Anaeroplasmataceae bacterium]|nr:NUDIX domain-containing protein [Anaeroplasmataceae bacterium]
MKYCVHCGTKLELKELEHEGLIPYCSTCKEFRFPIFNTAVSMIITTKSLDKTLLIEQYGKKKHILVAGYITKGESAEDAARREIYEEVGLHVTKLIFQKTAYFEKSNTLMINFIAVVENDEVHSNYEIDDYAWYSIEEGMEAISKGSLAEEFYKLFYEKVKHHEL